MACTCNDLNPWRRLRECPDEPSVFAGDPTFRPRDSAGRTMSQITSANIDAFEKKHGRSLGTVAGISDKADRETAVRQDQRRRAVKGATRA